MKFNGMLNRELKADQVPHIRKKVTELLCLPGIILGRIFDLSWKKNVKMKIFLSKCEWKKKTKPNFFSFGFQCWKKTVSQRFEIMFAFVFQTFISSKL